MNLPISFRLQRTFASALLMCMIAIVGLGCVAEVADADLPPLVIYAARSESLVGPLIDKFIDLTGINVKVKYGGTSELVTTLIEEGANSPADVYYSRDPGGLVAVSTMLSALPPDVLSAVPAWANSPDNKWVGTSARARTIVYNTDMLGVNDLPDSIEQFTDPKWRGKIGWSPTSGPTQTMLTAMRVIWGEERTRAWLEGISANDPIYYPNHTATVAGVGSGEAEVGFVNHYYLLRFLEEQGEDFPARNYYLTDNDPGNLVMVVGVGILESSRNRLQAEQFVRFLLSDYAQTYLTEQAFDYPLFEGIDVNPALKPLNEINRPEIDQTMLADIEATVRLMRDVGVIP